MTTPAHRCDHRDHRDHRDRDWGPDIRKIILLLLQIVLDALTLKR